MHDDIPPTTSGSGPAPQRDLGARGAAGPLDPNFGLLAVITDTVAAWELFSAPGGSHTIATRRQPTYSQQARINTQQPAAVVSLLYGWAEVELW